MLIDKKKKRFKHKENKQIDEQKKRFFRSLYARLKMFFENVFSKMNAKNSQRLIPLSLFVYMYYTWKWVKLVHNN